MKSAGNIVFRVWTRFGNGVQKGFHTILISVKTLFSAVLTLCYMPLKRLETMFQEFVKHCFEAFSQLPIKSVKTPGNTTCLRVFWDLEKSVKTVYNCVTRAWEPSSGPHFPVRPFGA